MTMVPKLRNQMHKLVRVAGTLLGAALICLGWAVQSTAQDDPVHFLHAGVMPPGAIGSQQLQRGGPLPGYFQPVEIRVPEGALISTAVQGTFVEPQPSPVVVGMLIGAVYRLRVTNIPLQPGLEVYPTIEVIDRLYPPVGMERKFPIPIDITQEELELALSGRFVTRVIYLEEPDEALPIAQEPGEQSYFEVQPNENPLDVADRLGRPMAILRLGARVPEAEGPDAQFLYGSPPLLIFPAAAAAPEAHHGPPVAKAPAASIKPASPRSSKPVTSKPAAGGGKQSWFMPRKSEQRGQMLR